MVLRKRRRAPEAQASTPPASHVAKRSQLVESLRPAPEVVTPRPTKSRVDPRIGRQRDHRDGIDDFELRLLQHGINFEDLQKGSKSFNMGTRTPYARLCHAVLQWWCSQPMGQRRVVWVDPSCGYNEKNVPKFSTVEGAELQAKGLAGARWVYSRTHLLEARAWARDMLALSPAERLAAPASPGEERG